MLFALVAALVALAGGPARAAELGDPPAHAGPAVAAATDAASPTLVLVTGGAELLDEPKIPADLYELSALSAADGAEPVHVDIEISGQKSQDVSEKVNFQFKTRDAKGDNVDVALLGLPAGDHWVLHGPWSDKSLVRNALAYQLANDAGLVAPQTAFAELVIVDSLASASALAASGDWWLQPEYRGVYVLTQKIKRGMVGAKKVKHDELRGYVARSDKTDDGDRTFDLAVTGATVMANVYPSMPTLAQEALVEADLDRMERVLFGPCFDGAVEEGVLAAADVVNVASFTDYFLHAELSKNSDAYRWSTYFYRLDEDGPLHMGPPWDFNIAFGNADYLDGFTPVGWNFVMDTTQSEMSDPLHNVAYWYHRLLQSADFADGVRARWAELRGSVWSDAALADAVAALADAIGADAMERNFAQFDILDATVWPNPQVAGSYEGELEYLVDFVQARARWMDGNVTTVDASYEPRLALDDDFACECGAGLDEVLVDAPHSPGLVGRYYDGDAGFAVPVAWPDDADLERVEGLIDWTGLDTIWDGLDASSTGCDQLRDYQLTSINASGEHVTWQYQEYAANAFDGRSDTKWLVEYDSTLDSQWLEVRFDEPFVATKYAIVSANDHYARSPSDWELLALDANGTWVTIHEVSGAYMPSYETAYYFCPDAADVEAFGFRLLVTDTFHSWEDMLQLAELQLFSCDSACAGAEEDFYFRAAWSARFTGLLDVEAAGEYEFWLTSSDGALLTVDDAVVVNNDYEHGQTTANGSVELAAGLHAVELGYFHESGAVALAVEVAGPSLSRQALPLAMMGHSNGSETIACVDVAECAADAPCGEHAECEELFGGFNCTCAEGFEGDAYSACSEIEVAAEDGAADQGLFLVAALSAVGGMCLFLCVARCAVQQWRWRRKALGDARVQLEELTVSFEEDDVQ